MVETCFLTKIFSNSYVYAFFLSKKTEELVLKKFHNSGFVTESFPIPRSVTFLIFCGFVYDISSDLNDPILAQSASLQVSYQNSRLVYEISQFPKQAESAT